MIYGPEPAVGIQGAGVLVIPMLDARGGEAVLVGLLSISGECLNSAVMVRESKRVSFNGLAKHRHTRRKSYRKIGLCC